MSACVARANIATAPQRWRLQYFGIAENAAIAADAADPEGDGAENLKQFGFGLHPWHPDSSGLPLPAHVGDSLNVSFTQPSGVDGITYGAEASTNLLNWIPVTDSGSGTSHTFTFPVGEYDRLFMRLKVTEP